MGFEALSQNTSGSHNTANGSHALFSNTTGHFNTANSETALYLNTTGDDNTADGAGALYSNTHGNGNTAIGWNALLRNTTASYNTATGFQALLSNTTGAYNTANGVNALVSNTTGNNNVASGRHALYNNTTGSNNLALGTNAGVNLTTGSNNIDIGNQGAAAEAQTIRIGEQRNQKATFIAGIFGTPIIGSTVVVNSSGKLGIASSSAQFKQAIMPMNNASETILALKPVTFRYKEEIDPERTPQFGLIAEEVAKVDPDLVVRDENGKGMTVRYEAVNAMLLNEFLKEHRKVQELEKQIEALTATVQKVSKQFEANKATVQLTAND